MLLTKVDCVLQRFLRAILTCSLIFGCSVAHSQTNQGNAALPKGSQEKEASPEESSKAPDEKRKKKKKAFVVPDGVKQIKDIAYVQNRNTKQFLDLYLPEKGSDKPLPVVVWVHGGGWKNGSKERCTAAWLAQHGYAVASINYRLTDVAPWPAQLNDCRSAVLFLRLFGAKQYNLDPENFGAWGSSAGAHLVALMGTADQPKGEAISTKVQAVCDWFGPTDLLTMPNNVMVEGKTEEDLANTNGAKLLGGTVRDLPELAKKASAFHQASAGDVPFLIMHGDKDPAVPLVQSQRLHKRLQEVGVDSKLHVIKDAGHGGQKFKTDEAKKLVLDFFDKHLK